MKLHSVIRTTASILALAIFSGAAWGAAIGANNAKRDWQKNPVVVEVDTSETVFAIGDPHGDPERLANVLASAKLIEDAAVAPDQVKWIGARAVLVVVGDMIDKGHDSLGVIALLQALQRDAASQGGQVIVTMGNHEVEFLAKPTGKKTRNFVNELMLPSASHPVPLDANQLAQVASCELDPGPFLCGLPIAVRVNDWFFSHGGNTDGRTIAELSAAIQAGFARDGFASTELVGDNSILEARLHKTKEGGLPWFQGGKADAKPHHVLQRYASNLGVNHLVQGHQYGRVIFPDQRYRNEETLFQRYGILFLIDSGMSRGIEESVSAGGVLRISGPPHKQEAVVICADGTQTMFWKSHAPDRYAIKERLCGI